MAIVIPFAPSIPFQEFSMTIDNSNYIFNARWTGRDSAWYFDVLTDDRTPIVVGVKAVLGCILGRYVNHTLFRDGVVVVADLSGDGRDATLDDFGDRVQVVRFTVAEALSLRVTAAHPDAAAIAAAQANLIARQATS